MEFPDVYKIRREHLAGHWKVEQVKTLAPSPSFLLLPSFWLGWVFFKQTAAQRTKC